MRFVAFDEAEHVRLEAKHFDSYVFFGAREAEGDGPQMYMNEVDRGVELGSHFHRVDQFQVFFGDEGSVFQRKPIPELLVHYTDAFSVYGPFTAAPDRDLFYATIRARSTNFGGAMPEFKDQRPYRGHRQMSAEVRSWSAADVPSSGLAKETIFHETEDGMAASLFRLAGHAGHLIPKGTANSGTAFCVVAGSVLSEGQEYGPRSLGWLGPGETTSELVAGPNGACVIAMTFPYPETPVTWGAEPQTALQIEDQSRT
jgi:hypothetical protein